MGLFGRTQLVRRTTSQVHFEYDESRSSAVSHLKPPEAFDMDNDEPKPAGRPDKRKNDLKSFGPLSQLH